MEHDTPLPIDGLEPDNSTRRAAWLAKEIRRITDLETEQLEPFTAELNRLTEAVAAIKARHAPEKERRTAELNAWHKARLIIDPRFPKTYEFPDGVSKATEPNPKLVVTDEEALTRFAETQGLETTLLKVTTRPLVVPTRKHFKALLDTFAPEHRGTAKQTSVPGLAVEWPDRTATFTPTQD